VVAAGCTTLGPQALDQTRLQYNEVVKRTTEEQLLLNIVRLHYTDTPSSLAVSGIAAQFERSQSVQLTPFFTSAGADNNRSFTAILPQAGVQGADRPTISLTPLDDQEFTRKLFTPLPLDGVVYLAKTTWPIAIWQAEESQGPAEIAAPTTCARGGHMSTVAATPWYGSDEIGLVCGYVFSPGGCGQPVASAEASAWLRDASSKEGREFIWLHFNAAHVATEKWLKAHLDLSDAFFEALREGSRSTRIEHVDGTLIAVLNDVIYDFAFAESSQVSTLWLSVDARRLISVRRQPLRSLDRLRMAVKGGESFPSPLALLVHLLRDQAEVLTQIVRNTTVKVDSIEDTFLSGRLELKRAGLGSLRRDLVRLQRLLAPEPAALFRLLNRPPAWMEEEEILELRQSSEEFSVSIRDMTGLQERIKLLQEEIATRISEQTNRSVFVLTAVTVLALPINMIAGLFGMNVGGVPLAQHSHGFWIVVALVMAFTAMAAWVAFRKRVG
jgi:zinc transporter